MKLKLILLAVVTGCLAAPAVRAEILAGWDVDLSSLDSAQVAAGIASAQSLAGTAVASEISILSGPGGNGVDVSGVLTSITTPTNIEIGLDNVGVGNSNMYRGIYAARNWFIEGNDESGEPYPIDLDKYLSFQITSTSGLDLATFELVARRQAMNTPSRVRNIYASFSTDGVNFSDYAPPTADGDPSDDIDEDPTAANPPAELQRNLLIGPRDGPFVPTLNPHKTWDLSEYSGVTDLWVRVQARGLPRSNGSNGLDPNSWLAIDDRGDLDTQTPLDVEANSNNPFAGQFATGNSDDGFDVILTGVIAAGQPGDFNGNGVVDAADYTVWLANLGADESGNVLGGNGNGGRVDKADYVLWRENYGAGQSTAAQALITVPEPATVTSALCLLSVTWGCFRRR